MSLYVIVRFWNHDDAVLPSPRNRILTSRVTSNDPARYIYRRRLVTLRRKKRGADLRFATHSYLLPAIRGREGDPTRVPKGIEANSTIFLLWPISLSASCFKRATISSLPPDNDVTRVSVYRLIRKIGVSCGYSGHILTEGCELGSIEVGSLFFC